jgi:hypothetical protein
LKYQFDPKAGIILVKTKVYGPRSDAIVNLAFDTGATWTLLSWETAVLIGEKGSGVGEKGSGVFRLSRVE